MPDADLSETLRLNEHGKWVPAEPLPDSFGLVWERCWRHRVSVGQTRVRAIIGGFWDARAVERASNVA